MLFHATFEYATDDRDDVHERFIRTGALPPEGVEMVGRWHSVEGNRGFLLAETEDPQAIARWLQGWTDLVSFELSPVLDDKQFQMVLG